MSDIILAILILIGLYVIIGLVVSQIYIKHDMSPDSMAEYIAFTIKNIIIFPIILLFLFDDFVIKKLKKTNPPSWTSDKKD